MFKVSKAVQGCAREWGESERRNRKGMGWTRVTRGLAAVAALPLGGDYFGSGGVKR